MSTALGELYAARELFIVWSWREIKARYKQSALGIGWAVVQPLAMTIVFAVVISKLLDVEQDTPYPIFVYSAMLPWTFFGTSLSTGVTSLVRNMGLLTKIYFPREVIPLASVAARFVDFLVAAAIMAGMMLVYQFPPTIHLVWIPLLVLIQILLTVGVVLIGSAVNVAYRDVGQVIPLLVQLWLYASPILYTSEQAIEAIEEAYKNSEMAFGIESWVGQLYWLNPMAGLLSGYRAVLLNNEPPDPVGLGVSAVIALAALLLGYTFFKRVERRFADVI